MSETGKYNPELQAKIRKSVDGPIDSGRHDENETKKDEEYDSLDYEGKVKSLENELMKEWQTLRNIKVEKVQKYKLQDKNGEDVSVEDIADLAFDDDYNIDSNFLDSFDIKKEEDVYDHPSLEEVFEMGISDETQDVDENGNWYYVHKPEDFEACFDKDGIFIIENLEKIFRREAEYRAKQEKSKLSLGKIFISTIINKPGAGHIERGSGEGIKKETYKRNAEFKRILEAKMLAYHDVEMTDKSKMSREDREIYDNMVRTSFDGHYKGYVIPSLGLSFTISDLEGVGTYVINAMPDVSNIQEVSEFFADTSKYPRRLITWEKEKGVEMWKKKIEEFLVGIENDFELFSTKKNVERKDWTLLSLQEDLRILGVKSSEMYDSMRSSNGWPAVETLRKKNWLGEGSKGWDVLLDREETKKEWTLLELKKALLAEKVMSSSDYNSMRSSNGWPSIETLKRKGWLLGEGLEAWDVFLGRERKKELTFLELQEAVLAKKIISSTDYEDNCSSNGWPSVETLRRRNWLPKGSKAWDVFLGRERLTFEELRSSVREAKIKSSSDYSNECSSNGWPSVRTLKNMEGWTGWDDFLGRKK